MRFFTQLISALSHPVFILIYAYFIYFNIDSFNNQMFFILESLNDVNYYWVIFLFIFFMAVFFPFVIMIIMYVMKTISSFSIPDRKERLPVLVFVIFYYLMTYYILRHWNENLLNLLAPFISFMFGGVVLLLLLFFITMRWKISLHTAAISGLCGGVMAIVLISPVNNLNSMALINTGLLLAIGVVSFSRLYLKAHSVLQILCGIFLGFSTIFSAVYFQWSI